MMKVNEFVETLTKIAKEYKTLYVMGCFGAPMNAKNKTRYCSNNSYNKKAERVKMINAASADTFGFDCVCLIKGVLWGWNGNKSKTYGGATYTSNGVPDISADAMITKCKDISADFSKIEIGEAVWLKGHIGVYIGNGLVVESSPKWDNKTQITALGNVGSKSGYHSRTWTLHGKLPYVDYGAPAKVETPAKETVYTVQRGDTLSAIAKKYKTTVTKIVNANKAKYPKMTSNYIVIGWKLTIPI